MRLCCDLTGRVGRRKKCCQQWSWLKLCPHAANIAHDSDTGSGQWRARCAWSCRGRHPGRSRSLADHCRIAAQTRSKVTPRATYSTWLLENLGQIREKWIGEPLAEPMSRPPPFFTSTILHARTHIV